MLCCWSPEEMFIASDVPASCCQGVHLRGRVAIWLRSAHGLPGVEIVLGPAPGAYLRGFACTWLIAEICRWWACCGVSAVLGFTAWLFSVCRRCLVLLWLLLGSRRLMVSRSVGMVGDCPAGCRRRPGHQGLPKEHHVLELALPDERFVEILEAWVDSPWPETIETGYQLRDHFG